MKPDEPLPFPSDFAKQVIRRARRERRRRRALWTSVASGIVLAGASALSRRSSVDVPRLADAHAECPWGGSALVMEGPGGAMETEVSREAPTNPFR
jgi:hypothetical protein